MTPPKTPAEWCLERTILHASVGIDKLQEESERETPTPTQFALFALLHAVKEMAEYFQEVENKKTLDATREPHHKHPPHSTTE